MPPSVELKKQVKAANDIAEVVEGYIQVQRAGKQLKALCPFHNDTRPSLVIDRQWQNFRCWSCDARGDVFDFVMKYEKVAFPEALRILAERAGIKLEAEADDPQAQARARLLDAMRWAESKYAACLLDEPIAETARAYLGTRRLSGGTVRQFGLGYAPASGEWLVGRANADGVPPDVLQEVGLIAARDENRGHYDRFRDRVMFPIRDVRGRTVGFGGRILPTSPLADRGPKYYNSADTPLFNKSDLLYGLDLARHPGSAAGYLAVVEGYTDVMMAHQCGVANVVATMGTALTMTNVLQLRRYVPKVVLVFDADDAGEAATDKALSLFWVQHDFEIKVTMLPDGRDPCDLLCEPDGPARFKACLENAQDVLAFKLDLLLKKYPESTAENTRRVVDEALAILALAPAHKLSERAQVKRELMINRIAQRMKVRLETVWARLGELTSKRTGAETQQSTIPNRSALPEIATRSGPAQRAEKQLLELLLAEPVLVGMAVGEIGPDSLSHTGLRRLLTELYAIHNAGQVPDLDALRVRLVDRPDLMEAAQRLQFVGRHTPDRPDYLKRVLDWFAARHTAAEKKALKDRLAEGADDDQTADLLRRLQAHGAGPSSN